MIQLFIPFKIKKLLLVGICAMMLSGCLGGTVAQQIARSIATSVTDSAVANAMDVQEMETQDRFALRKPVAVKKSDTQQGAASQNDAANSLISKNIVSQNMLNQNPVNQNTVQQTLAQQQLAWQTQMLQNSSQSNTKKNTDTSKNMPAKQIEIDPYKLAFIDAKFEQVKAIEESLPAEAVQTETPVAIVQSSQLVPVELFNLLIGEEKAAVYTKARLLGATTLPKQREWKLWRVATGAIKTNTAKTQEKNPKIITFLIPPDFGKLASGNTALVEIASPGELNIARYKIN